MFLICVISKLAAVVMTGIVKLSANSYQSKSHLNVKTLLTGPPHRLEILKAIKTVIFQTEFGFG